MEISIVPVCGEDISEFKRDMRKAFQKGVESEFGSSATEILPEGDIDFSLMQEGAVAYKAVANKKIVGGAIIVIDNTTRRGHLDFLYVKYGFQSRGVGKAIWRAIEELHPDTELWETYTPYFEKRNIHFYVNCCGFHIVEYFHQGHPDPHEKETEDRDDDGGMFRFEKEIVQKNE